VILLSVRYDLELHAIASAALGARARALDGRPDDGANSDEAGESEGIPVTGAKEGHGGWSAAFVDIYGDVGGGESGSGGDGKGDKAPCPADRPTGRPTDRPTDPVFTAAMAALRALFGAAGGLTGGGSTGGGVQSHGSGAHGIHGSRESAAARSGSARLPPYFSFPPEDLKE
jgi:hypothetical protein